MWWDRRGDGDTDSHDEIVIEVSEWDVNWIKQIVWQNEDEHDGEYEREREKVREFNWMNLEFGATLWQSPRNSFFSNFVSLDFNYQKELDNHNKDKSETQRAQCKHSRVFYCWCFLLRNFVFFFLSLSLFNWLDNWGVSWCSKIFFNWKLIPMDTDTREHNNAKLLFFFQLWKC